MALEIGTNCGFVAVAPTTDPGGANLAVDGFARALMQVAPVGNYKVTKLGWYQNGSAGDPGEDWGVGIYDDDGGKPGNLLTSVTGIVAGSAQWNTGVLDYILTSGETYWLAAVCEASSPATNIAYLSSGGTASGDFASYLPDPWEEVSATSYILAIYALYEEVPSDESPAIAFGANF